MLKGHGEAWGGKGGAPPHRPLTLVHHHLMPCCCPLTPSLRSLLPSHRHLPPYHLP